MSRSVLLRTPGLVLLMLGLASCATVNLAYDHADWWMTRMATRYVELDSVQEKAVRVQFGHVHAWHRSHELPVYAQLLDRAADRMQRGLTRADMTWVMGVANERWLVTSNELARELTPVLLTLNPEQMVQMADNLDYENTRYVKSQMDLDPTQRIKQRSDWLIKQIEKWTGDLTAAQRRRIAMVAAATPEFPELRLAERKRRQAKFLSLVRDQRNPSALQSAIVGLLSAPREGASDEYRRSVARYEEQLTQMLLDLDRSLSAEQRSHAVNRMRKFAQDFRALAVAQT